MTNQHAAESQPEADQPLFDFSKMRVVSSPNFTTAYAMRSNIAVSPSEIRIIFHRLDLNTNTDDSSIVKEAEIIMTPRNAFDLWVFLGSRLKDCQEQMRQFPQEIPVDIAALYNAMEKVGRAMQGLDNNKEYDVAVTQKD